MFVRSSRCGRCVFRNLLSIYTFIFLLLLSFVLYFCLSRLRFFFRASDLLFISNRFSLYQYLVQNCHSDANRFQIFYECNLSVKKHHRCHFLAVYTCFLRIVFITKHSYFINRFHQTFVCLFLLLFFCLFFIHATRTRNIDDDEEEEK